jgi:hypothetical protein
MPDLEGGGRYSLLMDQELQEEGSSAKKYDMGSAEAHNSEENNKRRLLSFETKNKLTEAQNDDIMFELDI